MPAILTIRTTPERATAVIEQLVLFMPFSTDRRLVEAFIADVEDAVICKRPDVISEFLDGRADR